MIIFRIYPKYSDKYALSYSLSDLIRVYTAFSITVGESKFIHPRFRYNVVRFFSFILLHFFSKCQKNPIDKILELFKIVLVQIYRQSVQLAKIYFLAFSIYLSLITNFVFET